MVKKISWLFLMLAVALSGCGTLNVAVERASLPSTPTLGPTPTSPALPEPGPTFTPPVLTEPGSTSTPPDPILSMASSPQDIQHKMLHSALNWKTIWIDGIFTDLTVSGNDSAHEQLWIDQAGARFRFLRGPVDGQAQTLIVSDGSSQLSVDIGSGATQVSAMPQGIADQFVPLSDASGGYLPNPLSEQISARASNLVFSSNLASIATAGIKLVGMEMVAGRQTLIVDCAAMGMRNWVDILTGVILKQQTFGEGGGSMVGEYIVTRVDYDIRALPDELFSLNPAWQPVFSDVMGVPPVSVTPVPATDNSEIYQVITRSNSSDGSLTDIYIRNASTRVETRLMSLPDVNSDNYHIAEYHNGNLYILRRMGDPQADQNWSDQLWRYDLNGNGKLLFSYKGLDFRVAPDGSYAAVTYQAGDTSANTLAFIDKNGDVVRNFNFAPTEPYANFPNQWSDDGKQFWGQLQFDMTPKTIYRISISDWSVKKFVVEPLNIGKDFALNANTGQIVYSDYPAFFDTDSMQHFIDSATKVHLFLYDLNTQALQTIATSIARPFSPKLLDNASFAYDDPNGGARIEYTVK
jgi:hypothetical protein